MIDFQGRILDIITEITNLKTACERGLGALNFYRKSASLRYQPNDGTAVIITAVANEGEVAPFMAQLLMSNTQDLVLEKLTTTDTKVEWKFYFNSLDVINFDFGLISSSDCTFEARQVRS